MLKIEADQVRAELSTGQFSQVYSRECTLGTLLRRRCLPDDDLNPLSLAARIRVFNLPSSFVYLVDFPENSFYGEDFIDLLFQAKRRKRAGEYSSSSLGLSGTVDDWRMPDIRSKSTNNLYNSHVEGLANPFLKFDEQDRRKYLYAANPPTKDSSEELIRYLYQNLLTKHMAENRMRRAEQDCQKASLLVSSISWSWNTRSLSNAEIPFSDLAENSQTKIIQAARKAALGDKVIIDPQEPPFVIREGRHEYHHPFSFSHLGNGLVEILYGKSFARYNLRGDWRRTKAYHIADASDYFLSPVQVWAKSRRTGERLWLEEDFPPELTEGLDPRANHRLGLVLATAVSQKERDILPGKLPLTPNGDLQEIREPQVVVLPYLTEEDIRRMVGTEKNQDLIMDPHQIILNGSYFRAVERSARFK